MPTPQGAFHTMEYVQCDCGKNANDRESKVPFKVKRTQPPVCFAKPALLQRYSTGDRQHDAHLEHTDGVGELTEAFSLGE